MKKRFFERLGLRLPTSRPKNGTLWIHALSVGEVISALPLVNTLRLKYPEKDIVFTVTTSKGMAIAQKELAGKVDALLTMPLDFWWSTRRIINHIKPTIFILIETDIWPALMDYLKRKGIKSILVNGRVSPRTFKSYCRFPFIFRKMFKSLESCLMQSDLDRDRLIEAGIESPEKVRTVGNIKFDREWPPMNTKERHKWLDLLDFDSKDLIWVAGSTHQGEEKILLSVFNKLLPSFSSLRMILAPRRIEQSEDILTVARTLGLKADLKTEFPKKKDPCDLIILNTLGELGRIYGLAEVSFVGGSLVPFGGHNLLEPASFGCPVVFGHHTHNFVLMSESLIDAGGGLRVRDEKELYESMNRLLSDSEVRNDMGRHARKFVKGNQGALERVVSHIDGFIKDNGE